MNRRNFLGSVIGLWASTPFLAKLITETPQVVEPCIDLCFYERESGLMIRAPGIMTIEPHYESWKFVANPLLITDRRLVISGYTLHYRDGRQIGNLSKFKDVFLQSGDTLRVNKTVIIHGSGTDDLKEALKIAGGS